MHFSIPQTVNLQEKDGSFYQAFNIHINGVHHCTLRYKQLRHLHDQLKKLFSPDTLPEFPSKKLLPLTAHQLEERRLYLEKYLQSNQRISTSTFFHSFLRLAQNETHMSNDDQKNVNVTIILPGEEAISVPVTPLQETSLVIRKIAEMIGLPEELAEFFALFIEDSNGFSQYCLVRRLLNYESPFLAVKLSSETANLVMRKSYWDTQYDEELLKNPVGTKLIYSQFLDDYKRYWVQPNDQQLIPLKRLIEQNKQQEVMKMARQIRYYGGIHFLPCLTDFPSPRMPASIYALNKELIFCYPDLTERAFRVTRIRSWRITTIVKESEIERPKLELSFEYLLSKDRLQWITIDSPQVIFLSLCLQSMVEELMRKQLEGSGSSSSSFQQLADEVADKLTFLKRNGAQACISEPTTKTKVSQITSKKSVLGLKETIRVRFHNGRNHSYEEARIENHVFEDIQDDDL